MFTITKDHLADVKAKPATNANAVGIVGPRSCKLSAEEIATHPSAKKFRMKDDDGELYYEGVYVQSGDSDELEPLDCFGTPNAGCTILEMWDKGWKVV